jgi:hypothetical protein
MSSLKSLARIAIVPSLGILLLSAGGCGNSSGSVDPARGEQLKQARIAAYGKSGMPSGRQQQAGTPRDLSGQASARRQAQGGR